MCRFRPSLLRLRAAVWRSSRTQTETTLIIHQLKPENEKRALPMIKEVAFIAIAVSDAERARKFYQETLELKPTSTQMGGAWVEYDIGPTTIWRRFVTLAWQPSRDGTAVAFEVDDIDADDLRN